MEDWTRINQLHWDDRAGAHARSPGYAVQQFVDDPTFLSHVVRFDLPRLGDVRGLRGVHLQCHIGTDTLSLHRLGARMTGLDFSAASLQHARDLAARAGAEIDYVHAAVYDALEVLRPESFDLVFTGIGALCWLPDIRRWAQVVSTLLAPGGRLFLREGHPMAWTLDDAPQDDRLTLAYPYFEQPAGTLSDEPGTYVETDHEFTHNRSVDWNHGLGEIVSALLDTGMHLTMLQEHDSAPWEAVRGRMQREELDEWRLVEHRERVPMTYTLQAVKPA